VDSSTGMRMLSRIDRRAPVIWSLGEDGSAVVKPGGGYGQDPQNDNLDNDGNGKVDDTQELINDICSWN